MDKNVVSSIAIIAMAALAALMIIKGIEARYVLAVICLIAGRAGFSAGDIINRIFTHKPKE